ncbi:MAG: helix-turn-helix domain-containing protein [Pyrinomonadaceae bacterium]
MNLTDDLILRGEDLTLSRDERARRRCADAKKLQDVGDHEGARRALGGLWQRVGERPNLEGLGDAARAEVLLRAGALSGFIGSSTQITGAQEFAKNLIGESAEWFRAAGETEREAEALRELGYCYWREGAHEEARVLLGEALTRLAPESTEERAHTLLRLAIVESSATRYHDALRLLTEAAPLFDRSSNDAKRGTFHMELAVVLYSLSLAERREDYTDRALVEYAAASYHFERAGHARYRAAAENNYAHLLFKRGDYDAAHAHLDTARRIFVELKDRTHVAQVDETRAHVLVAEGRFAEAEAIARAAVRALDAGGEQAILAEALTAHGEALARLGRQDEARAVLRRAAATAESAGDFGGAGLAELLTLEMLCDRLTPAEMRETYLAADRLLEHTQQPETLKRLRECARRVAAAETPVPGVVEGAGDIENVIAEACARAGKLVRFEPAAVAALLCLPHGVDAALLHGLVERTIARAEEGATITAAAVETVALRQQIDGADFSDPWANFSFRGEVKQFEERLIERALHDAQGSVSRAARLLGFKHHESLSWRLKNRNKDLLQSRTPARKRRRSVIRKPA